MVNKMNKIRINYSKNSQKKKSNKAKCKKNNKKSIKNKKRLARK